MSWGSVRISELDMYLSDWTCILGLYHISDCLFWGKSVIGGFYFHHFRWHSGWWCFLSHHFRQRCNWWVLFSLFQTKLGLVGFIFTVSDKAVIGGFYFQFQTKLGLVGFIFTVSDKAVIGGFYFHCFRQSCDWWVLFSLFQTKLWLVGCNSHQDWPERLHPQ